MQQQNTTSPTEENKAGNEPPKTDPTTTREMAEGLTVAEMWELITKLPKGRCIHCNRFVVKGKFQAMNMSRLKLKGTANLCKECLRFMTGDSLPVDTKPGSRLMKMIEEKKAEKANA